MKFLIVNLGIFITIMHLTLAKPSLVEEHSSQTCPLPDACARRESDGFCHLFNSSCEQEDINCDLAGDPSRQWRTVARTQCAYNTGNNIAVCKATCEVQRKCLSSTTSSDHVCVADSAKNCRLFRSLCHLIEFVCNNEASRDMYPVADHRCADIKTVGEVKACGDQ